MDARTTRTGSKTDTYGRTKLTHARIGRSKGTTKRWAAWRTKATTVGGTKGANKRADEGSSCGRTEGTNEGGLTRGTTKGWGGVANE